MTTSRTKIRVANPVVEMDGDEMTRIIWAFIKDQLILPYLDVDLKYYDLSIEHRDATDDQVTIDSANATKQYGVGVKCATITPDEARVERVRAEEDVAIAERHDPQHPRRRDLPRADHHLQHPAARARLDQADRRRPSRPRRPVQGDRLQGARRRHGHDHVHAGRRQRADGVRDRRRSAPTAGVAMGMYNFHDSIRDFARASLRYGLAATIRSTCRRRTRSSRRTTASSRTSSTRCSTNEFEAEFEAAGLTYEHRLIDDMVAAALKWEGGYVWACKNYDGDVQSDIVAQGFGSLGLMTSVLMTPDGKTVEAEAAHGTVTRHYREHQKGNPTSTNPIASIFAWTRGLAHRGKLDGTPEVIGVRRGARGGVHRSGRGRRDDEGSRPAHLARRPLPQHRGLPRRPRPPAAGQDARSRRLTMAPATDGRKQDRTDLFSPIGWWISVRRA